METRYRSVLDGGTEGTGRSHPMPDFLNLDMSVQMWMGISKPEVLPLLDTNNTSLLLTFLNNS